MPAEIHLLFLPPDSPKLQPADRLWPLIREAVANRAFANLAALEAATADWCRGLKRGDLI